LAAPKCKIAALKLSGSGVIENELCAISAALFLLPAASLIFGRKTSTDPTIAADHS